MRSLAAAVVVLVVACGDDGGSTLPDGASAIDAEADPCDACGAGELCVQRFDGTCTMESSCITTTLACAPNTCSAACEEALCPTPYQCQNRPPCGTESARAFTCYGP